MDSESPVTDMRGEVVFAQLVTQGRMGIVWSIWHIIPYVQIGNPPMWIFWQSLSAVALRILTVWTYNHTGKSVFTAILFHVMVNISWSLFPNYGSHFDPFVTVLINWITVVIVVFGSRTRKQVGERTRPFM